MGNTASSRENPYQQYYEALMMQQNSGGNGGNGTQTASMADELLKQFQQHSSASGAGGENANVFANAFRGVEEVAAAAQSASAANTPFAYTDMFDPYEVLGVPKNFSWEQLKTSYREKAKRMHPDKGGSEAFFNILTDCFRKLAKEYQAKQNDRTHMELKQQYESFTEQHQKRPPPSHHPASGEGGGSGGNGSGGGGKKTEDFADKFNRMFEENKLEDEVESFGYGHLMEASSKTREDINIPKRMQKYDEKRFHKEFERIKPLNPEATQVVKYQEPEPHASVRKGAIYRAGWQHGPMTLALHIPMPSPTDMVSFTVIT
jgi:DnaJ-domain-containing protein 1